MDGLCRKRLFRVYRGQYATNSALINLTDQGLGSPDTKYANIVFNFSTRFFFNHAYLPMLTNFNEIVYLKSVSLLELLVNCQFQLVGSSVNEIIAS